jgi:hypothetical protein
MVVINTSNIMESYDTHYSIANRLVASCRYFADEMILRACDGRKDESSLDDVIGAVESEMLSCSIFDQRDEKVKLMIKSHLSRLSNVQKVVISAHDTFDKAYKIRQIADSLSRKLERIKNNDKRDSDETEFTIFTIDISKS